MVQLKLILIHSHEPLDGHFCRVLHVIVGTLDNDPAAISREAFHGQHLSADNRIGGGDGRAAFLDGECRQVGGYLLTIRVEADVTRHPSAVTAYEVPCSVIEHGIVLIVEVNVRRAFAVGTLHGTDMVVRVRTAVVIVHDRLVPLVRVLVSRNGCMLLVLPLVVATLRQVCQHALHVIV